MVNVICSLARNRRRSHASPHVLHLGAIVRNAKNVACLIVLLPALALADPPAPAKPIQARVEVRHPGKRSEFISGTLVKWDDTSATLHAGDADRTVQWDELTGVSAYALLSRVIDRKDAQAWLKLGALAWGLNDTRDAKTALAAAEKLDPSVKGDVEAVEASGAGVLLEPAGPELMHDESPAEAAARAQNDDPHAPKYRKTTPADAKAALALTRAAASKVNAEMNLHLKEVESDHFLVFTDWDPSSYVFIKQNLEAANTCVSKQFEISPSENIFIGKLGVYMFNTHEEFLRFAVTHDHLPPNNEIQGYYASGGGEMAHMAMSKPGFGAGHEKEIEWAYVLTHEFTHAFVARYRSTRRLPTWINEGIAEVIASSQFPRDVRYAAVAVARSHQSLAPLFNDRAGMQSAAMYPVMRTVTALLISTDRKKFLSMFDELKAGAPGAKALMDNYGLTFDQLEQGWRKSLGVE